MPLPRTLKLLLLSALLVTGMATASPQAWELDPVHTRIVFAVDHAGFSKSLGTFSGITGTLEFDPDDLAGARIEVQVPIASLDFGDDKWNRASLAGNLLDAKAHPVAMFRSTRVEPVDATRAIVHGQLTLRGISREVQLDATVNAIKRHPLPPFRRTAGFSATTTLSRSDFGMTAWKSMIGNDVELRIEAEATRSRGAMPDDRPAEPAPAEDAPDFVCDDDPPADSSPTPDEDSVPCP